nr:uncharacterized protein LOC116808022 [Taeniopygia guttata]
MAQRHVSPGRAAAGSERRRPPPAAPPRGKELPLAGLVIKHKRIKAKHGKRNEKPHPQLGSAAGSRRGGHGSGSAALPAAARERPLRWGRGYRNRAWAVSPALSVSRARSCH